MKQYQGLKLFPSRCTAKGAWKLSSSYPLRDMDDVEINYVNTPSFALGKPHLTLHNGPTKKDPPLASMDKSAAITMHLGAAGASTHWQLKECSDGVWSSTHRVTGSMGAGGPQEIFEWRYTKRGVVREVGDSGWEMVRLTDGRESVVAVLGMPTWTLNKRFTFGFVNEGLQGMGSEFEVLAVITALWLEKMFHETR